MFRSRYGQRRVYIVYALSYLCLFLYCVFGHPFRSRLCTIYLDNPCNAFCSLVHLERDALPWNRGERSRKGSVYIFGSRVISCAHDLSTPYISTNTPLLPHCRPLKVVPFARRRPPITSCRFSAQHGRQGDPVHHHRVHLHHRP